MSRNNKYENNQRGKGATLASQADRYVLYEKAVQCVSGHSPTIVGLVLLSVGELLKLAIYIIIFSIFIRAILSWFSSAGYTPVLRLMYTFTEPVLKIFRRLLPDMGGLDFSPIAVFIVLMVVLKIVVQPLLDFGRAML